MYVYRGSGRLLTSHTDHRAIATRNIRDPISKLPSHLDLPPVHVLHKLMPHYIMLFSESVEKGSL